MKRGIARVVGLFAGSFWAVAPTLAVIVTTQGNELATAAAWYIVLAVTFERAVMRRLYREID